MSTITNVQIKLGDIKLTMNHRDVGDVAGMISSIKEEGQLVPVILHKQKGIKGYTMIGGHRRYMAIKKLGLKTVRAEILCDLSPKELLIKQAIENDSRKSLTVFERGVMYGKMVNDHGMTNYEIGAVLGINPKLVTNILMVLSHLPKKYVKDITYSLGGKKIKDKVTVTAAAMIANEGTRLKLTKKELAHIWEGQKKGNGADILRAQLTQKRLEPKKSLVGTTNKKNKLKVFKVEITVKTSQFNKYSGANEVGKEIRKLVYKHLFTKPKEA